MNKLFLRTVLLVVSLTIVAPARADRSQHNPIHTWNEQALETARKGPLSDAQAARLYAMVNVAMYDAVNGIDTARGKDKRDYALVAPVGAPINGDLYAAAAAAAHAVLSREYPSDAAIYQAELDAGLAEIEDGPPEASGVSWGAYVGSQVVALRRNDGSTPTDTQPAGTGPGVFRAAWSGVQFRNLTPFAIADGAPYISAGPPPLTSVEYAAALAQVKVLGSAAIPDPQADEIFRFWASSTETAQPPGEWIKVAMIVSEQQSEQLSLAQDARLFALLGMALADAVAPTLTAKYNYHFWRPATAIHEAGSDHNPDTEADPSWAPRAGGIGSSPEHTSGHSAFAGAGTTILRGFFCADAISFSLQSDSAPNGPRSYQSFSQAEAEAGRSRILGGVHFEFSNQAGLRTGRGVADEILATTLLRSHGPTHQGECPR